MYICICAVDELLGHQHLIHRTCLASASTMYIVVVAATVHLTRTTHSSSTYSRASSTMNVRCTSYEVHSSSTCSATMYIVYIVLRCGCTTAYEYIFTRTMYDVRCTSYLVQVHRTHPYQQGPLRGPADSTRTPEV